VVCLSGIISTSAVTNQFFLDRQANVSVFHKKLGLIISGANSKRQPELATFSEKIGSEVYHLALTSRLQVAEQQDRLSLAYNTFFSDLYVPTPAEDAVTLRFVVTRKDGPLEEAGLALQLCLKPGEELETGAGGKIPVGREPLDLSPEALGGWIRHHGWTLKLDPQAKLVWPVYPFSPYANGPEKGLEHAVAVLAVPVKLQAQPGPGARPAQQEILFTLSTQ
jgi:hypothetical protein